MTINDTAPTSRTAAATAAKMRKSEHRWAVHLRDRGWTVVPRRALEAMAEYLDKTPTERDSWLAGFRAGLAAVVEVSETIQADGH
jgi:hypothetical protein